MASTLPAVPISSPTDQTSNHRPGPGAEEIVRPLHNRGQETAAACHHDVENPYEPLLLENKLKSLSPLSDECCIYIVPKQLRRINPEAYTPKTVSIGPIHHGKEDLRFMEQHKQRYLLDFLNTTGFSLEYCVGIIKEFEKDVRDCYAETIEFDSNEFVDIILVDSAFIIGILLEKFSHITTDRIYGKPRLIRFIICDLMLLENQIPFFIIEHLWNLRLAKVRPDDQQEAPTFTDKVYRFFQRESNMAMEMEMPHPSFQAKHFVDFLKSVHQPRKQPRKIHGSKKLESIKRWNIKSIADAGVVLKVAKSKKMFDIRFEDGTLHMPKIQISDGTETFMRNLIAYEQCHSQDNYITDYCITLDCLIDTEKDIEILVRSDIMENYLGEDKEVSLLINGLAKECFTHYDKFYYASLSVELDSFCKTRWHRWKALLTRDYFNTPWAIISFIAAFILLVTTIAQATWSFIHP